MFSYKANIHSIVLLLRDWFVNQICIHSFLCTWWGFNTKDFLSLLGTRSLPRLCSVGASSSNLGDRLDCLVRLLGVVNALDEECPSNSYLLLVCRRTQSHWRPGCILGRRTVAEIHNQDWCMRPGSIPIAPLFQSRASPCHTLFVEPVCNATQSKKVQHTCITKNFQNVSR